MAKYGPAVQYPVRWWGYPNIHSPRSIKPSVLIVIHETGNKNLPSAIGEATYSNRDGSGASFTFVTNRDGSLVQCLDPVTQTPWTNGDVNQPSARAQRIMSAHPGHNFNEFCFMTCENVAYLDQAPITSAQKETLARLIAWGSKISGLPINRDTVLGHRDINSVTRWNCPVPGDLDKFLNGIIARAKEIAGGAIPDTSTAEGDTNLDWKAQAQKYWQWIVALRARKNELLAQIDSMEAEVAAAEEANQNLAEAKMTIRRLRDRLGEIKTKVADMAADVSDD